MDVQQLEHDASPCLATALRVGEGEEESDDSGQGMLRVGEDVISDTLGLFAGQTR